MLMVDKAETRVRSAATSLESAERERASTGKEHARQESGSWCVPGFRVWAAVQQRVRPPRHPASIPFTESLDSRRTKLEKLQGDVLELATRLDLQLGRPPTLRS